MFSWFNIISDFFKRRIFLMLWISIVLFGFYETFSCYSKERKFYHIRKILGLGLCISRGTATVINLCCSLILLPLYKKLNQFIYRFLSKWWPSLFFFWLERAKSFHMTVALTLVLFSVIHSISHMANMWNFSRNYDEHMKDVNFANYKNQNPFWLLFSQAGATGVAMLVITIAMCMTSMRVVRRRVYNAFWYTHQLYIPFFVMLIIHPLSGVLKEEVLEENDPSMEFSKLNDWNNATIIHEPKFIPIKSKNWLWMIGPLSCYVLDIIWRISSRNLSRVHVLKAIHMAGRTINLTISCPHNQFTCRMGQYILLQCQSVSLLEWHPFTVVKMPTPADKELCVWIRVQGDWTESLEKLLIERGPRQLSMSVDGPFSSPLQAAVRSRVCVCVAAGVGITPFVSILHHMLMNPTSRKPGRMHLLWIVRYEHEITWIADLATNLIQHLRNSNRPDRFNLDLYVTSNNAKIESKAYFDLKSHVVVINEKGVLKNVINDDKGFTNDERVTLLTPKLNRTNGNIIRNSNIEVHQDNNYDISKENPIIGCRIKRGRPHWDEVFGYWVHLYPGDSLNFYCCGPKKLVNLLRLKCKLTSRTTKTKFTFVHEGFG